MREIKFRAWNGNKMRYNVSAANGKHGCKPVRHGYQWFSYGNDVYDSELLQYTDLKDKNGKEIYEGDIVELIRSSSYSYDKGKKLEIVWDTKELCYSAFPIGYTNQDIRKIRLTANKSKMFRVIGNIYENPELLKIEGQNDRN